MRGRTLATLAAIGVGSAWVATIAVTAACTKGSKGGAADGPSEPTPIATLADAGPCQNADAGPDQPCYLNDPWGGDASRGRFFHLSEGSEIFPYPWLLALETDAGAAFFSTNAPPYGLLRDPPDPSCSDDTCNHYGQPVGMTVAQTRDLAWSGLEMFGFNCAACHVGELTAQGKTFRVIGGPNMFDIIGFLTGFKASIAYAVSSVESFMAFVARVAGGALQSSKEPELAARLQFAKKIPLLLEADAGSPTNATLTAALHRAFDDFTAHHPPKPRLAHITAEPRAAQAVPRTAWVPRAAPAASPIAPHVSALASKLAQAKAAAEPKADTSRGPAAAPAVGQEVTDAVQYLSDFGEVLALLLQRLDDVERILGGAGGGVALTTPGPGRVDAFMMAHNSLFANEPAAPMTSPVDYPRIWGLGELHWYHWDGNTNSLLERNVGQALGLGAIVDPASLQSTVQIVNIEELENLALAIPKPRWPFPFDQGLADSGATVFRQQQCERCHSASDGGVGIQPVDAIGTDPLREENFAMNMAPDGSFHGEPFVNALASTLAQVVTQAIAAEDASSDWDRDASWRLTGGYVQRPLDGIWATAPYLHNGSVATIDDLLTPPAARPASYFGGSRAYDTTRLGYGGDGGFPFGASAPGNGAAGHAYGIDASAADKAALIEYLKTL